MKALFLLSVMYCVIGQAQPSTSNHFVGSDPQITLYIVSQGYTTGSIGDFEDFVDNFTDLLWNTEPYETYKQKFRVVKVYDYATTDTYPRAYNQFSPPYECVAGGASGSEPYEDFEDRMDDLSDYLNADDNCYFLAVFNSNFYSGGGGKYTFVTDYCNNSYMYNVAIHEFGHSFALLGDEYGPQAGQSVNPGDYALFENRNVTVETSLSNIPWKYLIPGGTPIPTCTYGSSCSYTVTGLYEEANYSNEDWYRPQHDCKMRNVGSDFCSVCHEITKETIIKHLCPSNPTISESFNQRHTGIAHWRKSVDVLSSTSTVGDEVKLSFLAGDVVVLSNGFVAKQGSDFHAFTGSCSYIDIRNPYRMLADKNRSNEVHVKDVKESNSGFIISPNPADATVRLNVGKGVTGFTVIASDGKIVYSISNLSNKKILSLDVSEFSKGLYFVIAVTSTNEKLYGKFIKR